MPWGASKPHREGTTRQSVVASRCLRIQSSDGFFGNGSNFLFSTLSSLSRALFSLVLRHATCNMRQSNRTTHASKKPRRMKELQHNPSFHHVGNVLARGTYLPAPVSEKKVLKASSPPPMVLSDGIRLDAVLETVQLPAGVSHLDAGLAHVDRDCFVA